MPRRPSLARQLLAAAALALGCQQRDWPPAVDACLIFVGTAEARSCGDLTPVFGSCGYYGYPEYDDCDMVAYFECLSDLIACDPETGEMDVLALLPCTAFADVATCSAFQ